ncbi:hypothetical protein C3920_06550 [Novacetimonas pomaceti]|uniref:Uncharacterized protein n=1 Tax=Novacetimonas pomaceti TaxID=2021998 RepID=A0ABX5P2R5_9PROT|nr:hypothetical protein C3920_06550 [Novacetimonas pomaceti]
MQTVRVLVKLFSKSFEEHCLFEKRQRPGTFIFYQTVVCMNALTGRQGIPRNRSRTRQRQAAAVAGQHHFPSA